MTQEHALHPAREHRWITTYSGERINSLAVRPDQINKADMVRGLAMQTRYLGQIRDFYSIAEHSVLVARLAAYYQQPIEVQRAALLHDGHEYLTGDFPSPFKYDVPGLRSWEGNVERVFRQAMGLPSNDSHVWDLVKTYDLIALHYEAAHLMEQDSGWVRDDMVLQVPHRPDFEIKCYDWRSAATIFSRMASRLGLEGFDL